MAVDEMYGKCNILGDLNIDYPDGKREGLFVVEDGRCLDNIREFK